VKKAVIHLENGKTLTIRAQNQSPANVFVQKVEVNGQVIDRRHLNHKELAPGGEVVFHLSPRPVR